MTDNGIEFPIRIWLDNFNRQNIEDVKSLLITNQMSKSIRLDQSQTFMKLIHRHY